ncbi:hypothetical protein EYF80_018614 [Liparis tanakae]|uniref:Uncharacterized protein n=1 Tax=Liparis tanakae TaxID=230148 RepID=A0A4Z2I1D4_9TELE|nr:hypothetical protein EYF80_018614 [Liparis tanakae]
MDELHFDLFRVISQLSFSWAAAFAPAAQLTTRCGGNMAESGDVESQQNYNQDCQYNVGVRSLCRHSETDQAPHAGGQLLRLAALTCTSSCSPLLLPSALCHCLSPLALRLSCAAERRKEKGEGERRKEKGERLHEVLFKPQSDDLPFTRSAPTITPKCC